MKPNKVFAGTISIFILLIGGGSVFSEETCNPPGDAMLEDSALEAGKVNPPAGCIQVWSRRLMASKIKNEGGHYALLERWELLAKEIFVSCYRKGEFGVDTEKRYIPASTESVVHTLCTVAVTCDGGVLRVAGEIHCDIL